MTHQNLILTEEAIKGHCKRLKKELKNLNQDLSLCETQNLFSKALGFNNFHELKKVLNNKSDINNQNNLQEVIPYKFINSIEQPKLFNDISSDESIQIFINLINNKETNLLSGRAISLISAIMPALIYMRDQKEILLDSVAIREYLILDNIIKLYKLRRDFPDNIRAELRAYLYSLQDFQETEDLNQSKTVIEQHENTQMQFFFILKYLEKIERDNFIIADKNWFFRNNIIFSSSIKFGQQQQLNPDKHNYLILNREFYRFEEIIEDSWINMPEYEDYILYLEKNNKLNTVRVIDLLLYAIKIISPHKRKRMELLLNNILENYSFASNLSNKIKSQLNALMVSKFEKIVEEAISLNATEIIFKNINNTQKINILINDGKMIIEENNNGTLLYEIIFNILKSSTNEKFNSRKPQTGKVLYETKNINKKITYKSFLDGENDFSILLTLFPLL